ncbi:MAG: lysylphosphatidylglycerol synthase transmembrane domain-containing protein [bacterium]
MNLKILKPWLRIVGLVVGLVTFVLAVYSIPLGDLWLGLSESLNYYVVFCIGCWMTSILFQAARWRVMLQWQKPVRFTASLRLYILNRLTNLFLGFRAGEGVRIIAASKKLKIGVPFLMATIINERILNFVFLWLIAFLLTFFNPDLKPFQVRLLCGSVAVLGIGVWIFIKNKHEFVTDRMVSPESFTGENRFKIFFRKLFNGIFILKNPAVFRAVVLYSLGSWISLWSGVLFLQKSLQPENPALSALTVLFFINIASLLPLTPSNLGPFQWACILALAYFGVHKTPAVAFSLVLQGVRIVAAVLVGLSALALDVATFNFRSPNARGVSEAVGESSNPPN